MKTKAKRMAREELVAKMKVAGVCLSCRFCWEIINSFIDEDGTGRTQEWMLPDTRFTKEYGWQWCENVNGKEWFTYYDCKHKCPYELERMMEDEQLRQSEV